MGVEQALHTQHEGPKWDHGAVVGGIALSILRPSLNLQIGGIICDMMNLVPRIKWMPDQVISRDQQDSTGGE